jgi:E3 ubiquitin-protein ligase HERC2
VPLLRQQQIRLGLLKAARVLFSQQENLRQIMARPASSEGDQYSLFQQLLSAATRPSPIKVMFNRDELEVSHYFLDFFGQFFDGGYFLY